MNLFTLPEYIMLIPINESVNIAIIYHANHNKWICLHCQNISCYSKQIIMFTLPKYTCKFQSRIMLTLADYICKTQSRIMFTLPDYICKTQSRIMFTLPDYICKLNQGLCLRCQTIYVNPIKDYVYIARLYM